MNRASILTAALLGCISFLPLAAQVQPTRADAETDPVLKAMLAELDRSKSELQLPGFQKPFFIQYRIQDVEGFDTSAGFGATLQSTRVHQRVARVTVTVGDYKMDSSTQRGDGALQLANLSDDPIALRSALWQATDQAYKAALDAYAQKQAELKQVQTPPQADDFSQEKPVIHLEGPRRLEIDQQAWAQRVATVSGLYRTDAALAASRADVQYSFASFSARATTTRIVNSEGTIVRKTNGSFQQTLGVGTQAADGMRIDRSYTTNGVDEASLDKPEVFHQHAAEIIRALSELRKAPIVEEEYHGPLLLSSDSSADVLHNLLARGVVATRPRLGTEARTNGAFASSFHARVLPDFLNVVDDPTLKSWQGHTLAGSYAVDDEGVPAQAVELVSAGKLQNYLIGRQPVRDFPHSNGHARGGVASPPRPSVAVLKVTAENGLTDDELQKKLQDIARDRGLKSVYYAATMGPGATPRLLYRVNVNGTRQLVRGARIEDLDQRALRSNIEAAGKDLWVTNYMNDVPESVLAPALLLNDTTVKRANEKNDKLPFYPAPE